MMSKKMHQNDLVHTNLTYPPEYSGPETIQKQIIGLAKKFCLNPVHALKLAENLPALSSFVPRHAILHTGWFAFPKTEALSRTRFPNVINSTIEYSCAIGVLLDELGKQRSFKNHSLDMKSFQTCDNTMQMMKKINERQRGDILIIAAQLGILYNECKIPIFAENEFGLNTVAGISILLTHPNRITGLMDISMNCVGDVSRYCENSYSPTFFHFNGSLNLAPAYSSDESGTATFFVPPIWISSFF